MENLSYHTENGYEIDAKQSANIDEAIKLRKQYPNVGIVVVATDKGGVEWALAQEWSDVVIPFHTVRTGADVAEFYNWEIFNAEQNDTVTDQNLWDAYLNDIGKKKASKMVYPNEHQNNREKYLSICEKRGLTPRFKSFLDNANYMKLVNETRQSESQTSPLKAVFNLKAAERSFDKFVEKGGYYEGWYNDGIDVDGEAEIVAKDVKAGKKANEVSYGRQDVDFDTVAKTRKTNRQHGKASRELPVDKYTSKKYNRNRIPYNSFATEAMKWAHSDRTIIGEQKFFYKKGKWVLIEKSDDGYIEMGAFTDRERDIYAREIEIANEAIRDSIERTREGLREDISAYASLTGSDLRYNGDVERQRIGNDRSGGIYQSTSGSNGITDNQSGESGGGTEVTHLSRETVTSGQYEQMKANLSHSKVYTKKSAMELVTKIAPGIRHRSFEALSNQLWEGLNSYTTIDDKRTFAEDMAEIFVDRMMVDTLQKHSEWDAAVERMSYLKTGINSLDFVSEDAKEVQHILDKKGKAKLVGRWGYKSNRDGSFKRHYGLDEFISDLSREMPGMDHLAEMHPVDALVEVDSLYTELSQQIKEKLRHSKIGSRKGRI